MRMRRLELAVLAITLAFAFFMGGFFAGRSSGSVSISAAAALTGDTSGIQVSVTDASQSGTMTTPAASSQSPADSDTAASTGGDSNPDAQTPGDVTVDGGASQDSSQGTGAPKESDGRININTASQGELTDLPGIGSVLASRIVDYRSQNGSFANIEDIRNVSGIGEKRYEAIRDLITVG